MFYDRFKELAAKREVSVNKATQDIGLSKSTATKWKRTGATPQGDTLQKIADYFGVTVDYLLTGEQKEKTPAEAEGDITFDDFTYAMHNEGKDLTEAQREALLDMARRFNQYQKDMKDKK